LTSYGKKTSTLIIHSLVKKLVIPDRKQIPGTAGGTVRCNAVTVARAISSGLYFFLQSVPISNFSFFKSTKNRLTNLQ